MGPPAAAVETRSLGDHISTFAGEVSVVGLRYAFLKSASWFRRALWLILVLGGLFFTAFQVQNKIQYLLSYPTKVNVRIRHNQTLRFPTVTICNENFVRKSKAEELGVTDLVTRMYPPIPMSSNFEPNFTGFVKEYNGFSWTDIYNALYQEKQEAIRICVWDESECNATWFDVVETDMGSCFQFNSERYNLLVYRDGTSQGLKLALNANQSDYLCSHSVSAGFRVLLHSPWETPLMQEMGFKVSTGFHTSIGITQRQIIELEPPWGECDDQEGYTYTGCVMKCQADYMNASCGCRTLPMPGDVRVCNPEERYRCVQPALTDFARNNIQSECHCVSECERIKYTYSLSQATSSVHAMDFAGKILNQEPETVRHNYAITTIFFSELSYEETKTEKAYDVLSLLCDVGGAFGLVLGSTVLTLCEIVDFCTVRTLACIMSLRRKKATFNQ